MSGNLSPVATAAVAYAHQRWLVVPLHVAIAGECSCPKGPDCPRMGKHPRTKNGLNDATTNEALIAASWERAPNANVGVRTGLESGFFVLDVDIDPGKGIDGPATLAALEAEHGELPTTRTAQTGRGGRHYLFQHPGPGMRISNDAGKRLGHGLDVRGDGGYIVAPPSLHASGRTYEWENDHPIAVAPAWLLERAKAPDVASLPAPSNVSIGGDVDERARKYGVSAIASAAAELAKVMTGGNNALNTAAMRLAQLAASTGITEADVERALREACVTNGLLVPAYEQQFRWTFRSGWKSGLKHPRSVPPPSYSAAGSSSTTAGDDGPRQAKMFTAWITPRPWRSQDLRDAYERWCKDQGVTPALGPKGFDLALSALGWGQKKGSGGIRLRVHPLAGDATLPGVAQLSEKVVPLGGASGATSGVPAGSSATPIGESGATSDELRHSTAQSGATLGEVAPLTDDDRAAAEDEMPDWTGEDADEFDISDNGSGGDGGDGSGGGDDGGGDGADRPRIAITNGELDRVVDEAENALLSSGIGIYQRGGVLVRAVTEPVVTPRGIERGDDALLIKQVEQDWLVEAFTRVAHFQVWDGRSESLRRVDCPSKVARTYLARAGEWAAPPLLGLIEAPTIRPDGSVLEAAGYDQATGLLFEPGRTRFNRVPTAPTLEDAKAAVAQFRELLAGFPFEDEHDFSIVLACILTALTRRNLPCAPLFAFNAHKPSSGKSLLTDVVCLIATGRPAAKMTPTSEEEEETKRLFTLLLQGDTVAVIDNIMAPWFSAAMCTILTEETFEGRVLGRSASAKVSTCVTWMCTGNNLVLLGDLTTRALRCDLDPQMERPETRKFDVDLREWIPRHRAQLVPAALTILRAYHLAGAPAVDYQPSRFETWDRRIRAPLLWAGVADPCLSFSDLEAGDTVKSQVTMLLAAWHRDLGSEAYSVQQAVGLSRLPEKQDLRTALLDVAGRAGEINTRSLGKWLSKYQKRIEGGFRVEKVGIHVGNATWRVVQIPPHGFGGRDGLVSLPHEKVSESITHVNIHELGETKPSNQPNPPAAVEIEDGDL